MAIPGPGSAISATTIATEFGGTVPHSLSEYYRGGGLVPNTPGNAAIPTTGAIPMAGFYGSANRTAVALTISADSYNYDVYANRGPAYVAGATDLTVTVNPGVTVGSTSTAAYAMLVPSSFNPGDTVTIVNNGVIQGMGGSGGQASPGRTPVVPATPGNPGGNAIYVNRPTTITNNGTVAGGGGGGGGANPTTVGKSIVGGGGGGGGAGFNGGAGGPIGPTSSPGAAGSPGTSTTGGAGGASGGPGGRAGGPGGGRGAAGTGVAAPGATSGGSAGNFITGNPFVTWPATGTRQGGVA